MTVSSDLVEFLRTRDGLYFGKALELREAVKGWLAYVPQSFPHYTRHTVEHSDEIILQMSKLLFRGDSRPVVDLSPVEAYILIAAAYLHDAGMVASDSEKVRLMASEEWKTWTWPGGGGAKRLLEIQQIRENRDPGDATTRHFIADVQLRFLIAEFVRRAHHLRAGDVIREHQAALGRFAFEDVLLSRTIAQVCIAHGIRHEELDDPERFPDRRDVRGQAVNVRFLATILRLGDLLDMSCDRACPVLLNAACPLPSDSLAHWTQYQRIVHRLTAPDRIEIVAECETQDEHRVLQDWCQWIVEEVRSAREATSRGRRHQEWQPPVAQMEGPHASIVIRPAKGATYLPSRWTFELNAEAVFERLIHDVYETPGAFVRELIQNALDATRCQMYQDLEGEHRRHSEYPNEVPEEIRERYPITVTVSKQTVRSELSGETEERQVVVVEDLGIGMDADVIHKYFLQVGRSFYTTEEFARRFAFVPSSRFGVGFLSTFAVGDRIVVETFKPSSSSGDGPLRLTLHGPRKYLLTERGGRRGTGTRIEVWMREAVAPEEVKRWVSRWCRRVEFPIVVRADGADEIVVQSEDSADFVYTEPLPGEGGAIVSVRAFPIERSGIFGDLYVLAYSDEAGESWGHSGWLRYTLTKEDPRFGGVRLPGELQCLHGIEVSGGGVGSQGSVARLDFRAERFVPFLSRDGVLRRRGHRSLALGREDGPPEVVSRWEEILREHLDSAPRARGDRAWAYRQSLVDVFPVSEFWAREPGMIPIRRAGSQEVVGLTTAVDPAVIVVLFQRAFFGGGRFFGRRAATKIAPYIWEGEEIAVSNEDLRYMSRAHRDVLFSGRFVKEVRYLGADWAALTWVRGVAPARLQGEEHEGSILDVADWPDARAVAYSVHQAWGYTEHVVGNGNNPFIQWMIGVEHAVRERTGPITRNQVQRLIKLVVDAGRYGTHVDDLVRFIERWRSIPGLPGELIPPDIRIAESFETWRAHLREGEVSGD